MFSNILGFLPSSLYPQLPPLVHVFITSRAESVMVIVKHHGLWSQKYVFEFWFCTFWLDKLGKPSVISEMQLSLIWTNLLHVSADWFIYSFIGTIESLWPPTVCRDLCYSLRIKEEHAFKLLTCYSEINKFGDAYIKYVILCAIKDWTIGKFPRPREVV